MSETTREERDVWRQAWGKGNMIHGEDAADSHGRLTARLCDQVDRLEAEAAEKEDQIDKLQDLAAGCIKLGGEQRRKIESLELIAKTWVRGSHAWQELAKALGMSEEHTDMEYARAAIARLNQRAAAPTTFDFEMAAAEILRFIAAAWERKVDACETDLQEIMKKHIRVTDRRDAEPAWTVDLRALALCIWNEPCPSGTPSETWIDRVEAILRRACGVANP